MAVDAQLIQGQSFVRKTMTTLVMLLTFISLAVLGWYANEENKSPQDYANLPLIPANTDPFKIKPSDPGGMKIENTEIQLYDEISNDVSKKRTDVIDLSAAKLAPPPEEPVKLVEVKVAPKAEPIKLVKLSSKEIIKTVKKIDVIKVEKKQPIKTTAILKDPNIKEAEPVVIEAKTPTIAPTSKPEPKAPTNIASAPTKIKATKTHSYDPRYKRLLLSGVPQKPNGKVAIKTTKPAAKSAPPAIKRVKKIKPTAKLFLGSELIQLGSYQSRASVKSGWKTLKSKYNREIGNLSLSIKEADLGPRGVYYRMLAGPFKSKSDAAKMCKRLTSKGQDCLVAR